ncbi:MAG: PIN domain nuclease [Candidatus Omnitrophica bacterium]|nr:PIN domain nuclease [Candidatus Omnitrophota bacterium]
MMKVIRVIFFILVVALSYYFFPQQWVQNPGMGVVLSAGIAMMLIGLEYFLSRLGTFYFLSFLISLFVAFVFTIIVNIFFKNQRLIVNPQVLNLGSLVVFLYLCFCASLKLLKAKFMAGKSLRSEIIIMDTSAIIDGRIADIWATKFLSARLLIPRFVLKELQRIADSQDPLKRARGRRGLDILNRMRKAKIDIIIDDQDFPEIKEVDAKLVQMAKLYNAPILTTDYNLNKVAELQGVTVLNINDLANALRPVFLPGERLKIRVVKEGKEHNQGVGYLEDGTMVVVEEARHLIGNFLDVEVKSVLQTSAGRIIFTRRVNH